DAAEILKKKAQWLKEHPEVHLLIEGHCDERGTEEYNLALGERRANSAKEFLVNLGIDPKRISVISYGEERPVDPRSCEEAWAKNRRDHFVIVHY
ncbi:MAG: peptidoglycan-associated lipoprotein Pal, partial [Thermodesulfobacteriota bacterium]